VFNADLAIWVDDRGHVTRAKIVHSTGNATTDETLVSVVEDMPVLDSPPPSFPFPQKIAVSGKRPG